MKRALLRRHGVISTDGILKKEYTNECVTFILKMGKISNYRFIKNDVCTLELPTVRIIFLLKFMAEKGNKITVVKIKI